MLGLRPLPAPGKAGHQALKRGPLIVSGFFGDERGVGRAGRLTLSAFERAGYRPIAHDLTHLLRREVPEPPPIRVCGGVWVLHCNAPEAGHVLRRHLELSRAPLYRVGYWAWELPEAPRDWLEIASYFHEIWTPSAFSAGAFAQAPVQVRTMPHCLPPSTVRRVRGRADAGTRFLTFADLRSTAARKNPIGAIKAYLQAFPVAGSARLVVKLTGVAADRRALGWVRALVEHRRDIEVMTETLSDAGVQTLVREADVVISLHRSEGFGLTIAEAMAQGKAVVATGWSGNVEYMTSECARQLVPYSLTEVHDPSGVYAGQRWAEPDVEVAARMIRTLAEDGALRARLGALNEAAIGELGEAWTAHRLNAEAFTDWLVQRPDASPEAEHEASMRARGGVER